MLPCVAGSSTSSVDGDVMGRTVKPHHPSGMAQDVKVWFSLNIYMKQSEVAQSLNIVTDLTLLGLLFHFLFSLPPASPGVLMSPTEIELPYGAWSCSDNQEISCFCGTLR